MKAADREATARELVELLDRIDEAEEAIRKATKEAKERVGGLRDKARELRDLLAGKKGAQLPLAAAVLEEARAEEWKKARAPYCEECGQTFGTHNLGCSQHPDGPEKPKKRRKKAKTVEEANEERRGAARAVGAGIYESVDPELPDEPPVMCCTECQAPRTDAAKPCRVCEGENLRKCQDCGACFPEATMAQHPDVTGHICGPCKELHDGT
jgi:hypothetical protein